MNGLKHESNDGKVPILVPYGYEETQPAVVRSVQQVLDTLPPQATLGLHRVILRSSKSLGKKEGRERARSRSGLVRKTELQGVYYGGPKEKDVRIELFVDRLLSNTPPWFLRIPPLRDLTICQVLCHELGHHIQTTRRIPGDPETVAEEWSKKLSEIYFRERYGHLRLFFKIALLPLKAISSLSRYSKSARK